MSKLQNNQTGISQDEYLYRYVMGEIGRKTTCLKCLGKWLVYLTERRNSN